MIYTSYFSNFRHFPDGARLISISRNSPQYFAGEKFLKLSPNVNLLNAYKKKKLSEEDYEKIFNKYLESLDKQSIRSFLDSDCTILLCYERPNEFCHRHLVAKWLGDDVKEL